MVCLGNICINTLHKGDNDDDDDDDDNNTYYFIVISAAKLNKTGNVVLNVTLRRALEPLLQ